MNPESSLSKISEAELLLKQAQTPIDAASVADVAAAAAIYAKRSNAAIPVINNAVRIKIEAERMAGQMLAGMEMRGRPGKGFTMKPLSELGISKTQSHRWQKAAMVSDDEFNEIVDRHNRERKELTSAIIYKAAVKKKAMENVNEQPKQTGTCTDLNDLISSGQKFGTIYADPPWQYNNQGTRGSTGNHYSGDMSIDEICAMPIPELCADQCHLHLWTTNAFLFECPKIFDAWGFEFKSSYVWVKPQMGMGNYWRNSHEIMLLAIKGGQRAISRGETSWVECRRGRHSAKPDKTREAIERLSPGPYLELFGRKPVSGWTVFGNQIEEELF